MFDSKSPLVKFTGYFVVGFFGLIIVISFGMPDFLSTMGVDTSVAAVVNGKKIHAYDYFRFRDRYRETLGKNLPNNKNFDNIIFNNFIGEVLILQKAEDLGFTISDERLMRSIKGLEEFKNQATGKYDPERFKLILRQNNMSIIEFFRLLKSRMMKKDMFQILNMGMAVSSDEMQMEYLTQNSKIKIKFAFLPSVEIDKRFRSTIDISGDEIDEEMKKNPKEFKDPGKDRERVKKKLATKKMAEITENLISRINTLADNKGSFDAAASLLKGKTGASEIFKIGENIKETGKKGKLLTDISNSQIFRDTCLTLEKGKTSKVIKSAAGLYIFTPVVKDIKSMELTDKESALLVSSLESEKLDMITTNLMTGLSEKAKVVKNLKTD